MRASGSAQKSRRRPRRRSLLVCRGTPAARLAPQVDRSRASTRPSVGATSATSAAARSTRNLVWRARRRGDLATHLRYTAPQLALRRRGQRRVDTGDEAALEAYVLARA